MNKIELRKYLFAFVFLVFPGFLLGFLENLTDKERFAISLIDAENAEIWEMTNSLVPVAPWNNYIIWNNPELEKRDKVLVASYIEIKHLQFFLDKDTAEKLKSSDTNKAKADINGVKFVFNKYDLDEFKYFFGETSKWFNNNFPNKIDTIRGRDFSWVSVVPEVQFSLNKKAQEELHAKKDPQDLSNKLRIYLNQKLGLWPDEMCWPNKKGKLWPKLLVLMWVKPEVLLRPAKDSEIFDTQALSDSRSVPYYISKQISQTDPLMSSDTDHDNQFKKAAVEWNEDLSSNRYLAWFSAMKKGQYTVTQMPWTRLGYTYDWSRESFLKDKFKGHYGFSEFCVKPLHKCEIVAVYSLDKYAKDSIKREYENTISIQFKNCVQKIISEMTGDVLTISLENQEKIKEIITKKINAYSGLLNLLKNDRKKRGDLPGENDLKTYTQEIKECEETIKELIGKFDINDFLNIRKKDVRDKEYEEYMRQRAESEPDI